MFRRLWLIFILFFSHSLMADTIETIFRDFDRENVPGASVLVVQRGNILLERSYGLANLESRTPSDTTTNYRLASVSKQFTAMAIMILKERNLLSYKSRLTDLLPEFPSYGRSITVCHLLTHTSGLQKYEKNIPPDRRTQLKDIDVLRILLGLRSTYFQPGSQYQYSNSGYAILAMITERISGRSFPEFLKENIFIPLGMDRSVVFSEGENEVENRAYGYSPNGSSFVLTDQNMMSAVLGDGGVYSSLADYYKWDQALYGERLVSRQTLDEAFSPARLNNGSRVNYGFGWRIGSYKGRKLIHHTGSSIGFRNAVLRFPNEELTVVVLANRNSADAKGLAYQVVDRFLSR